MEKIGFFHMNQLGDLLFSLPLLQAVRRERPAARLYSIVRPELASILTAAGLVDAVIEKRQGIREQLRRIALLRKEGFDNAVLFSESPESLGTAFAAGIRRRYGFRTASLRFLLTDTAPRQGVPSLANNRALAAAFGITNIAGDYTGIIKVPASETERVDRWLASEHIDPRRLVIVSPGASRRRKDKCWPDACWVALTRRLQEMKWQPVFTGAPSERAALASLAQAISPATRIFTAPDGILSLAALLSRARFFTGIDSGAMHLAAALGVPVIALFGATDPAQIGPRPLIKHTVIQRSPIENITPDEVLAVLAKRMVDDK